MSKKYIFIYISILTISVLGILIPVFFIYHSGGLDLFLIMIFSLMALLVLIPFFMIFKIPKIAQRKKGPIDYTEVHDEYIRLVTRKKMDHDEPNTRSYNNPLECMDIPLPQIMRLLKDSPELEGLPIKKATDPDEPSKGPDWRIFIELESP